jgi:hypothetical protein
LMFETTSTHLTPDDLNHAITAYVFKINYKLILVS